MQAILTQKVDQLLGAVHYHLRIDTLGFDLECSKKEWDKVVKGDKVHIVYHRHSKQIEIMNVLESN
mgnify:CR=1 FL=1